MGASHCCKGMLGAGMVLFEHADCAVHVQCRLLAGHRLSHQSLQAVAATDGALLTYWPGHAGACLWAELTMFYQNTRCIATEHPMCSRLIWPGHGSLLLWLAVHSSLCTCRAQASVQSARVLHSSSWQHKHWWPQMLRRLRWICAMQLTAPCSRAACHCFALSAQHGLKLAAVWTQWQVTHCLCSQEHASCYQALSLL